MVVGDRGAPLGRKILGCPGSADVAAALGERPLSLHCRDTPRSVPDVQAERQVERKLSGKISLPGDVRLSELPAPERSFRYALEGRQCGASFGNSSTRTRPEPAIPVSRLFSSLVSSDFKAGNQSLADDASWPELIFNLASLRCRTGIRPQSICRLVRISRAIGCDAFMSYSPHPPTSA